MNFFSFFHKWLLFIWILMGMIGLLLLLLGWSQPDPVRDPFIQKLFENENVNPAMKTYYHWISGVIGSSNYWLEYDGHIPITKCI